MAANLHENLKTTKKICTEASNISVGDCRQILYNTEIPVSIGMFEQAKRDVDFEVQTSKY